MKYQRSSELRHGAGFSTGRVRSCCTAWDTWLDPSSSYFARPYTLDYRKPDGTGHLEGLLITIPEAENLIQEEIIHDFQCDISLLKGMSSSKSESHDITDINDLAVLRSPGLTEPVTPEHLQKNMSHGGLRLDRMRFAEYPWSERRYYWHNDDGSHHFSAARYQAGRLQQPVPLTGALHRYSVNVQMVPALRNKWQMFVIPKEELFGSFYDSMKAFESPFAWSALPENMHDPRTSGTELCIIWLERDNARACAAANVLARYGFPDFGETLTGLARYGQRKSVLAG
ncbi:DUF6685 family protein (plasmid) [Klebsiella pneumoniae]|nr:MULTISPECIES: DUF6685 family protein [Klebsiella]KDM11665.1 hypothetical protein AE02_03440 [Klebsiella variicola]KMH91048.1 hypothetical protein SM82_04907 [Klebsiella pneumoniae]MDX6893223.1 DUF6685 family protein [Klebsiella aerogenes]PVF84760.1 hypothetical protein CSC18_4876 [Klebsiella aerogenes]WJU96225.1 hypothetical protein QU732_26470 [Klebsiella pneumoniae]